MTHFKDYLRDIYISTKMEQEFDEWIEELGADTLGIFFKEYLSQTKEIRKLGKIAYIVLNNQ